MFVPLKRVAGYSPLDFTVLDPHWGTIADWQAAIDEIHARGMYIMADFTVGTMADLIGFQGYVYMLCDALGICLIADSAI